LYSEWMLAVCCAGLPFGLFFIAEFLGQLFEDTKMKLTLIKKTMTFFLGISVACVLAAWYLSSGDIALFWAYVNREVPTLMFGCVAFYIGAKPVAQKKLVVGGITYTAAEGIDLNVTIPAKPYTDWLATVDRSNFNLRGVHFQSLDMFGPTKVGFVKFKVDVVDAKDRFVPNIIFARGGSMAVLVVLVCEGREYAVLTVQPRLAAGCIGFEEVCAGMLDGSSNFAGVAAKELDEELGIKIAPDELVNLTQLAGMGKGILLSPGACEEFMHFFALVRHVSRDELEAMDGRCTGLAEEGEQIVLKIVPLDRLQVISDGKTQIIYALFQRLRHVVPGALGHDVPVDRGGGEYHGILQELDSPLTLVGKSVLFDSH
jgi:ADP-sugar diphosphatase